MLAPDSCILRQLVTRGGTCLPDSAFFPSVAGQQPFKTGQQFIQVLTSQA